MLKGYHFSSTFHVLRTEVATKTVANFYGSYHGYHSVSLFQKDTFMTTPPTPFHRWEMSHTAGTRGNQDLSPGSLAPERTFLSANTLYNASLQMT